MSKQIEISTTKRRMTRHMSLGHQLQIFCKIMTSLHLHCRKLLKPCITHPNPELLQGYKKLGLGIEKDCCSISSHQQDNFIESF